MDKNQPPTGPTAGSARKSDLAARRTENLRANLLRRKKQTQDRMASGPEQEEGNS